MHFFELEIDDPLWIGDDILITVVKIKGSNEVRIGINAPLSKTVLREEMIKPENRKPTIIIKEKRSYVRSEKEQK